MPDSQDRCPGFNDNNDQDRDGIPDGCDTQDGTPPAVSIGGLSIEASGFTRTIVVPVSAFDNQSGVNRIDVSVSYTYHCDGDIGGQSDPGPQTFEWPGPSHTFRAGLSCDVANRAPGSIRATATVTATNGDGVTSRIYSASI